nr:MAG TPA: hypothetical protein [Caudoviricetes sp.]
MKLFASWKRGVRMDWADYIRGAVEDALSWQYELDALRESINGAETQLTLANRWIAVQPSKRIEGGTLIRWGRLDRSNYAGEVTVPPGWAPDQTFGPGLDVGAWATGAVQWLLEWKEDADVDAVYEDLWAACNEPQTVPAFGQEAYLDHADGYVWQAVPDWEAGELCVRVGEAGPEWPGGYYPRWVSTSRISLVSLAREGRDVMWPELAGLAMGL